MQRYPSNRAPNLPVPASSPKPIQVPAPANDNFKTPKPANDNFRREARSASRAASKYMSFVRGAALWTAYHYLMNGADAPSMGNTFDGYEIDKQCSPGGGVVSIPGDCGVFVINKPSAPQFPPVTGRPATFSQWSYVADRENGLQEFWIHNTRWKRIAGDFPDVQDLPSRNRNPVPDLYPPIPSLEPWNVPINQPAPTPGPIPVWALPNVPNSLPIGVAGQGRQTGTGARVSVGRFVPATSWEITPRAKPRPINRHELKPTDAGTKERKFLAKGFQGVAFRIVNVVSEFGDFVDSLYDALPVEKKIKREYTVDYNPYRNTKGRIKGDARKNGKYLKPITTWDKAKAIYRHFEDIDIAEALTNLVSNEVEDRVIGSLASRTQRGLQRARKRGYGGRGGLFLGPAL